MASDSVPDSSEKTKQAFTDNLDVVFNYVRSKTYPENFSREDKKQLRRKAKNFVIQDSSLLYRLNGNVYTNDLFLFEKVGEHIGFGLPVLPSVCTRYCYS